jgi:thioredoxin-dependent peroxiredoxin
MQDFYEPKVGDLAPDFRLPSTRGKDMSLRQFRGQDVILYFYPQGDTAAQAQSFQEHESDISKAHAAVLGVSTGLLDSQETFNFPLLADATADVAKMYGAWKEKNLGGRRTWGVTRTTYWIGPDGRIRKIYKKVEPAHHAEEVLADLNASHKK